MKIHHRVHVAAACGVMVAAAATGVAVADEAVVAQPGTETANIATGGTSAAEGTQPGTETTAPTVVEQTGTETTAVDPEPAEPAPGVQPGTETATPEVEEPTAPVVEETEPVSTATEGQTDQTPAVDDTTTVPQTGNTTGQTSTATEEESTTDATGGAAAAESPSVTDAATTEQPVTNDESTGGAPTAVDEPVSGGESAPADSQPVAEDPAPVEDNTTPAPSEPVAVPEPSPVILRHGEISAHLGQAGVAASYVTIPNQTVFNASATDGRYVVEAPSLTYGTYHDGVAEIGVGTADPAPVKLDPAVAGAVDAGNRLAEAIPQPVLDVVPAQGDYSVGNETAGAQAQWQS